MKNKVVFSTEKLNETILSPEQAMFAANATMAEMVLGKHMNQTGNCTLSSERLKVAQALSSECHLKMVLGALRLVIIFRDGSSLNHRMSSSPDDGTEEALAQVRITSKF